jgi:hypothetical protein
MFCEICLYVVHGDFKNIGLKYNFKAGKVDFVKLLVCCRLCSCRLDIRVCKHADDFNI